MPRTRSDCAPARTSRIALTLLLAALMAACASPASYTEPITKFQKASTIVIESARLEYGAANTYERNAIIDRLASRKQRLGLPDISGPDHEAIGPNDLRARMLALDALAKHGEFLLALASNDASKRSKESAIKLGDSLGRLSESLKTTADSEFKVRASNFGKIAGSAVDFAIQTKITEALNQAIEISDASVSALIRQIRRDMENIYERRRSILSEARVLAINAYNEEVAQPNANSDRIEKAATRVKQTTFAFEKLQLLVGVGPGLDAMTDAHLQLVVYARSTKSPQQLSDLIDAVDVFVARAVIISEAIKAIDRPSKE